MNSIMKLFLDAINNKEVEKFFKGEGIYKIPIPHMVPINTPTDWTEVSSGIYELYGDRPDLKINQLFEDTLLDMIEKDIISLYAGVNLFCGQLLREFDKSAPFEINKSKLLPLINQELIKKCLDLKKDFRWMGAGQAEGLWSEIKRLDDMLKKETGQGIL